MSLTARQVKFIRSLQKRKFRVRHGLTIVDGVRGVVAALNGGAEVEWILVSEPEVAEQVRGISGFSGTLTPVDQSQMKAITGVSTPPGVLLVAKVQWHGSIDTLPGGVMVALDGVQDPGNVGTIIRTCSWFGIRSILVGKGSADPFSPKVVRSTAGAVWRSRIFRAEPLVDSLQQLQSQGYKIVAATQSGIDYRTFHWPQKCVLVMGSEGAGVSDAVRAVADQAVTIGGDGGGVIDSLNVGVAAGILVADCSSRKQSES